MPFGPQNEVLLNLAIRSQQAIAKGQWWQHTGREHTSLSSGRGFHISTGAGVFFFRFFLYLSLSGISSKCKIPYFSKKILSCTYWSEPTLQHILHVNSKKINSKCLAVCTVLFKHHCMRINLKYNKPVRHLNCVNKLAKLKPMTYQKASKHEIKSHG